MSNTDIFIGQRPILLVKQIHPNDIYNASPQVEFQEFELNDINVWDDIKDWAEFDNILFYAVDLDKRVVMSNAYKFEELKLGNVYFVKEQCTQYKPYIDLDPWKYGRNQSFVQNIGVESRSTTLFNIHEHSSPSNHAQPSIAKSSYGATLENIMDSLSRLKGHSSDARRTLNSCHFTSFKNRKAQRFENRSLTLIERQVFQSLTNEENENVQDYYFEIASFNFNEAILQCLEDKMPIVKSLPTNRIMLALRGIAPLADIIAPIFTEAEEWNVFSAHLLIAAYENDIDRFKTLYEYEDNSSIITPPLVKNHKVRDSLGRNILHFTSSVEIATYILDQDPSLMDTFDVEHLSPLAHAIVRNLTALTQFYLNRIQEKPTLNIEEYAPINLLTLASYQGSVELVQIIIKSQLITPLQTGSKEKEGNPKALHICCYLGRVDLCKSILEKWGPELAGINTPVGTLGDTPLLIAVKENNYELADLLIKYHADTNYCNYEMQTIWFYALKVKDEDLCILLLNNGARPILSLDGLPATSTMIRNVLSMYKLADFLQKLETKPPTHICDDILRENIEEVRRFLKESSQLFPITTIQTPLHIACATGNVEIISLLLPYFNPNTKNYLKFTPGHICKLFNHDAAYHILQNHLDETNTDISGTSVKYTHKWSENRWLFNPKKIFSTNKSEYIFYTSKIVSDNNDKVLLDRITQLYKQIPKYMSKYIGIECLQTVKGVDLKFEQIETVYLLNKDLKYYTLLEYFANNASGSISLYSSVRKLDLISKVAFYLCVLHNSKICHGNICMDSIKVAATKEGIIDVVLLGYNLNLVDFREDVKDFGKLLHHLMYETQWEVGSKVPADKPYTEGIHDLIELCLDSKPDIKTVFSSILDIRNTNWSSFLDDASDLLQSPGIRKYSDTNRDSFIKALDDAGKFHIASIHDRSELPYFFQRLVPTTSRFDFFEFASDVEKVVNSMVKGQSVQNATILRNLITGISTKTALDCWEESLQLLKSMLIFPKENYVRTLDIFRALLYFDEFVNCLLHRYPEILLGILDSLKCPKKTRTQVTISIRLLCNLFKYTDGVNWVLQNIEAIFKIITSELSHEYSIQDKSILPLQLAVAAFLCNVTQYLPEKCPQALPLSNLLWLQMQKLESCDVSIRPDITHRYTTSILNLVKLGIQPPKSNTNISDILQRLHKIAKDETHRTIRGVAAHLLSSSDSYWTSH